MSNWLFKHWPINQWVCRDGGLPDSGSATGAAQTDATNKVIRSFGRSMLISVRFDLQVGTGFLLRLDCRQVVGGTLNGKSSGPCSERPSYIFRTWRYTNSRQCRSASCWPSAPLFTTLAMSITFLDAFCNKCIMRRKLLCLRHCNINSEFSLCGQRSSACETGRCTKDIQLVVLEMLRHVLKFPRRWSAMILLSAFCSVVLHRQLARKIVLHAFPA